MTLKVTIRGLLSHPGARERDSGLEIRGENTSTTTNLKAISIKKGRHPHDSSLVSHDDDSDFTNTFVVISDSVQNMKSMAQTMLLHTNIFTHKCERLIAERSTPPASPKLQQNLRLCFDIIL